LNLEKISNAAKYHNSIKVGEVQAQKEFLNFGKIDLSIFKERKVPKNRNRSFKRQNRRQTGHNQLVDFNLLNKQWKRPMTRAFANFNYSSKV
jgi:hypothetical protein